MYLPSARLLFRFDIILLYRNLGQNHTDKYNLLPTITYK